jgi:hypothetical protein
LGKENTPATHVINVDLARVNDDGGRFLRYLAWGDFVEVGGDPDTDPIRIRTIKMIEEGDGSVHPMSIVGTVRQPSDRRAVIPRDESTRKEYIHPRASLALHNPS